MITKPTATPFSGDLRTTDTWQHYEKEASADAIESLQSELLRFQQATYKHGNRIVLVFEGADASGKGGAIRRLTARLDPRGFAVHPIGAPDKTELEQHYLQRFWRRFPQNGQIAIFDRSWYGRVLVERVDALTPEKHWQRGYEEINTVEKMLLDDEVIVLKFFMHISRDTQKQRLRERIKEPDKRWKIGQSDLDVYERWDAYTDAWNDMLIKTSTELAPWHVIAADNKYAARVAVLNTLVNHLDQHLVRYGQHLDPELVARAEALFGEKLV